MVQSTLLARPTAKSKQRVDFAYELTSFDRSEPSWRVLANRSELTVPIEQVGPRETKRLEKGGKEIMRIGDIGVIDLELV